MTDKIIKAFEYGVNYGLLLAEQERDGEFMTDVFGCMGYSLKHSMPSTSPERRRPRSNEWREEMAESVLKLIDLCKECKK